MVIWDMSHGNLRTLLIITFPQLQLFLRDERREIPSILEEWSTKCSCEINDITNSVIASPEKLYKASRRIKAN